MVEEHKQRGRPKGAKNSKREKYKVEVFDILADEWKEGGNFKSYIEICEKYKYSYDIIRDIKNGRNKQLSRIFKITKI